MNSNQGFKTTKHSGEDLSNLNVDIRLSSKMMMSRSNKLKYLKGKRVLDGETGRQFKILIAIPKRSL